MENNEELTENINLYKVLEYAWCFSRTKEIEVKLQTFANIQRQERNIEGRVDTIDRGYEYLLYGQKKLASYARDSKPWLNYLRTAGFNKYKFNIIIF